jgi:hypothetical protein
VHHHTGPLVELLALAAVGLAAARRRAAAPVLAAAALAEVGLYAAMTQAGFSGNPRYVLPALALFAVLAGAGAAHVAQGGARLAGALAGARLAPLAGAALACAALAFAGSGLLHSRLVRLKGEAHEVGIRMRLHEQLARAVQAVGGPRAVNAQGFATANRALQTRLAWELGVPIGAVESTTDYRIVFRSWRELIAGRVKVLGHAKRRPILARVGSFRVYRRDGVTFPEVERYWAAIGQPFTRPLQGIHTLAKDERIDGLRVVTR